MLQASKMEKIHFADLLMMQSQFQVFLLSVNLKSDGMTSHKHGLAAKYSFKMTASKVEFWAFFETNFFRIACPLEAETSVSRKAEFWDDLLFKTTFKG